MFLDDFELWLKPKTPIFSSLSFGHSRNTSNRYVATLWKSAFRAKLSGIALELALLPMPDKVQNSSFLNFGLMCFYAIWGVIWPFWGKFEQTEKNVDQQLSGVLEAVENASNELRNELTSFKTIIDKSASKGNLLSSFFSEKIFTYYFDILFI